MTTAPTAAPPATATRPDEPDAGLAGGGAATGGRVLRLLVVAGMVLIAVLIGSPASAQPGGGCAIPPEPDRPGSGLVGMLDPTPAGAGGPGSVYGEVGYAGMTWHTYDICSRPDANSASTDTWVGSTLFNAAKTIVAAANGLHYQLSSADQLNGLDNLLHDGIGAMYRSTFTTWVGPALLVLAVTLLLAARGDLAAQAQRAGVAVAALALGAAVYAAPVSLLKASDTVLLDGISQMQQGFLTELKVGDRNSLPDALTDQIVFTNWERGEFGSAETAQARDLGRDLLRSQTFTRAEVAAGQDTAAAATRKKQDFQALTSKMGDRYAQFQGIAGSRVGTGGIALLQAIALAAFPAAAKLIVFIAVIILRLLVLFAPLIAVIAIMRPQIMTGLFRLVAGVAVNAILAGALAAAHAWLVVAMLRSDSGVNPILALIVASVVSVLFWVLIRPVRRLMTLGSMVLPRPRPREVAAEPAAPTSAPVTPVRTALTSGARAPARALLSPTDSARPTRTDLVVAQRPRVPAPIAAVPAASHPSDARPEWSQRDDNETTPPWLAAAAAPMGAAVPGPRRNGSPAADRAAGGWDLGDRRARP